MGENIWEEVGFLHGVDEDLKPKFINVFNEVKKIVETRRIYSQYNVIVFPIVKHILTSVLSDKKDFYFRGDEEEKKLKKLNILDNFDVIKLLEKLDHNFLSINNIVKQIDGNENDVIAESCLIFGNLMVNSIAKEFGR